MNVPLVLGELMNTDMTASEASKAAALAPKIRLRIGYKVPFFTNAGIAVIRVPVDTATKLIDAFATI